MQAANAAEAAAMMQVPADTLESTLQEYATAATAAAAVASFGGSAAAAPADSYGRAVRSNPPDPRDTLFLARVTPVVHYCMGGVEVDSHARALSVEGHPLPGLYAAGEVSGG